MFWDSIKIKKAIKKQLRPLLKTGCTITEICTFTAQRTCRGDWEIFVLIVYPFELGALGWTCGYCILDYKTLKIIKNGLWPSVFWEKDVVSEAEDILKRSN